MNDLLLTRINRLAGITQPGTRLKSGLQMQQVEQLNDAWLLIRDGRIVDFGTMNDIPDINSNLPSIDLHGKTVLPALPIRIPIWYMPAAAKRNL